MFRPFGRHLHSFVPWLGFDPAGVGRFGRGRHGPDEDEPWPGRSFGPFARRFGGFGPPRPERLFGRGDFKYLILDLLKDQPRHGYDIIRTLEERFRGFYTPSPGSVYPTLQLLEDQGYVTSSQQDGKRVYAITAEGQRILAERAKTVAGMQERLARGWGSGVPGEVGDVLQEVHQLGRFLFRQGTRGALRDREKLRRLREVVQRARKEIEAIFGDDAGAPPHFM